MQKILVTGGAGFIGSHTCEKLLKEGYSVVCVDNLNDYYDPEIKKQNIDELSKYDNFKFHKVDTTNYEELEKVFKESRPETIIHLAARAGVRPSISDPLLYSKVNILGTQNMLELSRIYKIENFVFASSSSVYGNSKDIPFKETANVDKPISPYAATKKAGELLCSTYHHLFKIPITCLRFFTVYGPKGRPDMAPYLFTDAIYKGREIQKFGDGSTRRDYTYISDIVQGVIAAAKKKLPFEILNLGNHQTVSLNEFIETIEEIVGKKAIIKEVSKKQGDVDVTYADITKAQNLLGYKPTTNIADGMKKFFDWYLNNNADAKKD
ncbi:SDR family NAD(P)-dependent oxidoreductase [Patescibacteria group bacterium]|nr:SDR family NAD(P)-dependent oxidoreductase [Patescibacteria group bacterium]